MKSILCKDKKILIIMPKFFSYQQQMKKVLDEWGATSFFYDEEPPKVEYLIKKNIEERLHVKGIYDSFNRKLLEKIEREVGTCDYFLLIRGNVISEETIDYIRRHILRHPENCTYYTWDSFAYLKHGGKLGYLFPHRLSFDSEDVKADAGYQLLPLFYSGKYDTRSEERSEKPEYQYDYCAISSFFPYRYETLLKIREANPDKKLYLKLYLNENVYKAKRIKEPQLFRHLDMSLVTLQPFAEEEIVQLESSSKCVLDITHTQQRGLTMRTMETVGLRQKLVTTNPLIREYDFYNEQNIKVIEAERATDAQGYVLPSDDWLDAAYVCDESIREKYSIYSWLDNLILWENES